MTNPYRFLGVCHGKDRLLCENTDSLERQALYSLLIQQYVLDNLIEDEILSTNSLLGAVSKVCSEEQFNNILSILIETPIPCTDVPKLERKEDSVVLTKLKNM